MMTEEQITLHDRQVEAVMNAVAKMAPMFQPMGFSPEAIFEGAIKGGAIALIGGAGASPENVAELLDGFAAAFRNLDKPNLTVVR